MFTNKSNGVNHMNKQYDKNRLVSNIEYLLKKRNIKVGDLESKCGVSTGYISRLKNNESNDVSPSAEVLLKLSMNLNVSLTSLLCSDYEAMTETELFLQMFLVDMISKTEKNQILWDRYASYCIYDETFDDNQTRLPIIDSYPSGYGNENLFYRSMFTEKAMAVDKYYYTLFLNGDFYYLIPVSSEDTGTMFELYILLANQSFKKVCCSDGETHSAIAKLLNDLFTSVEKSCKQVRIDDDVKKSLEDFIFGKEEK